jgi:tRNA 2-thiouridine synthesizing protein A
MSAANSGLDLAELGCGDLVIALMKAMKTISPGQTIRITAHDKGAAQDIPAWCRMTGHTLVEGPSGTDGSVYVIRKKGA